RQLSNMPENVYSQTRSCIVERNRFSSHMWIQDSHSHDVSQRRSMLSRCGRVASRLPSYWRTTASLRWEAPPLKCMRRWRWPKKRREYLWELPRWVDRSLCQAITYVVLRHGSTNTIANVSFAI